MAKTTVNEIVSRIKRRADYDITDSDLDTLIIDIINDDLKELKQLFLDNGLYDEISAHDTFTTVANQAYIALGTETPDFDQQVVLSQRTNDDTVDIIPYSEFVKLYPDPTANTSTTARHGSFFANRIYLGPTPSATGTTYYLDYIKLIADVAAGGTLPFESNYDPLLIAMARLELVDVLGTEAEGSRVRWYNKVEMLKHTLIIGAVKNIGLNLQSASRRDGGFSGPRIPES